MPGVLRLPRNGGCDDHSGTRPVRLESTYREPHGTARLDFARSVEVDDAEFPQALGVRCTYCHDDSNGLKPSEMDFASDAKPEKEIARLMLGMVTFWRRPSMPMVRNLVEWHTTSANGV